MSFFNVASLSKSLLAFGCIFNTPFSLGQIMVRDRAQSDASEPTKLWLPYAFNTETFDLSVGVGGVVSGLWQEQMTIYGTAFHTKNDSSRLWLGAYDIKIPGFERLFLSPEIYYTDYTQVRAYISGNSRFPNQPSGTNDSHPGNFVTGDAEDTAVRMRFRYVLPIGDGKKEIINRYSTVDGLPVPTDEETNRGWNPNEHGRSYLMLEPFFRDQRIEFATGDRSIRSNGLKFELSHNNTDFALNPSKGSIQKLFLARDFGSLKSDGPWTHWSFDYRKYLSLGESPLARQQVIALNMWIADTPTWKRVGIDGGIEGRPPYYDGSALGGFDRLRAYPDFRFNDRSAIYYAIEYRVIPHWNPLSRISFAGIPKIDWWQWTLFAEAGRVGSSFDLSELHDDMKTDAGFGIRAYSQEIVGRLDVAFSEEGSAIRAMIGHPF